MEEASAAHFPMQPQYEKYSSEAKDQDTMWKEVEWLQSAARLCY
jgi:hypothetical protein